MLDLRNRSTIYFFIKKREFLIATMFTLSTRLIAALLVITAGSAVCSAMAAQQQVLRVGFMNSIKKIDNGKYSDYTVDIMRTVAKHANIKVKMIPMPIGQILARLKSGNLDMAIGLYKRTVREEYSTYIDTPVGWIGTSIYTLNTNRLTSFQQLIGQRVGLLNGSALGTQLSEAVDNKLITPTFSTSYSVLAKMLANKRLEAVVAATSAFGPAIQKIIPKEQYTSTPYDIGINADLFILVSKKAVISDKQQLINTLNRVVKAMADNNEIEAIYQRNSRTYYQ